VLSPAVLVFGTILISIIWALVERDWEVRDQDLDWLDTVHKPLGIVMAIAPPEHRGKKRKHQHP